MTAAVLLLFGIFFLIGMLPLPIRLPAILLPLAGAIAGAVYLFLVLVWLPRFCRSVRHGIRGRTLYISCGAWLRFDTVVSLDRVTQITVLSGPLEHRFGVVMLLVCIPGTFFLVPAVTKTEAAQYQAIWEGRGW